MVLRIQCQPTACQGGTTTGVKLGKINYGINFRRKETNTVEKMIQIKLVSVGSDKWMLCGVTGCTTQGSS